MENVKYPAACFLSVNWSRLVATILAVAVLCIWNVHSAQAGHPSWQGGGNTTEGNAGSTDTAAASGSTEKPNYVQIPAMNIPVIGDGGISQNVSLSVVIETTSVGAADDVRKNLPRLNDAYITDLYSLLNGHDAVREGVVQVAIIKRDLETISRKVVGEDKIKDVLLQVLYQKRM